MSTQKPWEQVGQQVKEDAKNVFEFIGKAAKHIGSSARRAERMVARCQVCLDEGQVGNLGARVPCPACVLPPMAVVENGCATCRGTKRVGSPGFEVACPVCSSPSQKLKGQLAR
jgi:hypothetical protein